jgi:hypothetical protein
MKYFIINKNANVVFDNGDMIGKNNLTDQELTNLKLAIINGSEEQVRQILAPELSIEAKATLEVKKMLKQVDSLPCDSPFILRDFNIFMKDFPEVPVPKTVVQMYYSFETEQDRESVLKFWKLLVLNPNTRVRNELPKFLFNNGFHLTQDGLIVTFRRAWNRSDKNLNLYEWVINEYSRRKLQKKKVKDLPVYELKGVFSISDTKPEGSTFRGDLDVLYAEAQEQVNSDDATKYYADHATQTRFYINDTPQYGNVYYQVGKTTSVDRDHCDANSRNSCSKGLHSGVPNYVVNNRGFGDTIFMCLVNPYDVVSSPEDGWCKIRTSAIHIMCTITGEELEGYLTNKTSLIDFASPIYHQESLLRIFKDMQYTPHTNGLTPEEYSFATTDAILKTYDAYISSRNITMFIDEEEELDDDYCFDEDDESIEW